MENKKKRFINAICLITVGCLLFSTSTFAAQKNTSIKNPLKINIEESIKKQITDKDIEYVSKITNAMSKEKVNIVSRDVLSREDIVSSNESQLIVYRDGDLIGLEINPTVVNEIELEVVQDIVNSDTVGNGNYITIYDYHNAEKPNVEAFTEDVNQTNLNEKPEKKGVGYYIRNGKATKSGKQYKDKDTYITSVAKGQTKTLEAAMKITRKLELSGSYYSMSVTNGFSATVIFKTKVKYSSENMAAGTNCRKFYIRTYKQNYKRTQTKVNAKTNAIMGKKTATIKKPSSSAEYSVDVKI